MSALPEDIISCESCSCNIVRGDEYDNGQELLCEDCFAEDYAADQRADALMRLQMSQPRGRLL